VRALPKALLEVHMVQGGKHNVHTLDEMMTTPMETARGRDFGGPRNTVESGEHLFGAQDSNTGGDMGLALDETRDKFTGVFPVAFQFVPREDWDNRLGGGRSHELGGGCEWTRMIRRWMLAVVFGW